MIYLATRTKCFFVVWSVVSSIIKENCWFCKIEIVSLNWNGEITFRRTAVDFFLADVILAIILDFGSKVLINSNRWSVMAIGRSCSVRNKARRISFSLTFCCKVVCFCAKDVISGVLLTALADFLCSIRLLWRRSEACSAFKSLFVQYEHRTYLSPVTIIYLFTWFKKTFWGIFK